jgi:UPF0716 protein FxsA
MPLLLLLLIAVPLAELYVIVQVGDAIGTLPTVGLLLLSSLVGAALLRSQGRLVWTRFRTTIAAGRVPAHETVDGALVIVGGALMLVPGFITDVLGALLLLPPSRAVARRGILRGARGRMPTGVAGAASHGQTREDYDVDATARDIDVDPPRLHG